MNYVGGEGRVLNANNFANAIDGRSFLHNFQIKHFVLRRSGMLLGRGHPHRHGLWRRPGRLRGDLPGDGAGAGARHHQHDGRQPGGVAPHRARRAKPPWYARPRVCLPPFIEEGFRHLLKVSRMLFKTLEPVMQWRFLSCFF